MDVRCTAPDLPMPLPRSDKFKICGLLALFLGLALLDRSFATWRDDFRNFPDPNGVYLPPEADAKPQTFFQQHGVLKTTTFSGLGLLLVSVVLLGKDPGSPDALTEPTQPTR